MTTPLGGRSRLTLPSLALQYPRSLGVYEQYADAQRAVDYLSDNEFPVRNCMIVGTELKQVERITGRLTYARAALAGVASGAPKCSRIWPSSTSSIRPLTAPRMAAICCKMAAQSVSCSRALSSAPVCPLMRLTLASSFFLS